MRYDTVFLDVDGTLLWVEMDMEGYARDLSPYSRNGDLTAEEVARPVREGLRRHIKHNARYRSEEELEAFKEENAAETARRLEVEAPPEVLAAAMDERLSFRPYPESEEVLRSLRGMGLTLCIVSNWDILLPQVLEGLGWNEYFDFVVASAQVGSEKPDGAIFEAALELSGADRASAVHVGNDPTADVQGAAARAIDAVLISRRGEESPEAVATFPDLRPLPRFIEEGV